MAAHRSGEIGSKRQCRRAGDLKGVLEAARTYQAAAQAALAKRLASKHIDAEQRAAHGFAWIATSVAALEAVLEWAEAGKGANPLDEMVSRLAFSEAIGQLVGGLPMGQNELLRPTDLGLRGAGRSLADACAALLEEDLSESQGTRRRARAGPLAERDAARCGSRLHSRSVSPFH